MSYLLNDIIKFEEMMDEIKKGKKVDDLLDLLEDDEGNPWDKDFPPQHAEEMTAFCVVKEMMTKFKEFCDVCERAWKVQEIPAPLRQRLITMDQYNQDRYQKLYLMIQKYAEQMKQATIRDHEHDALPEVLEIP